MKIISIEKICILARFENPFPGIIHSIVRLRLKGKLKTIRFMGITISWIIPGFKKRPDVVVESGWLKSKEGE